MKQPKRYMGKVTSAWKSFQRIAFDGEQSELPKTQHKEGGVNREKKKDCVLVKASLGPAPFRPTTAQFFEFPPAPFPRRG